MLDNGEPQPRAAGGMALVHPVEPLEHPSLGLPGNADAGVRHRDPGTEGGVLHRDGDAAVWPVVGDGVVAEVIDDLLHDLGHAPHQGPVAPQLGGHLLPLGRRGQLLQHGPCLPVQVHGLPLAQAAALVQTGELDDVVHQPDEPLGLPVDVPGEVGDVLRLHQAVAQDLRRAQDGGQGRLQLVGDVGGELPPQPLPLLLLRHIQNHQHRAGDLPVLLHRAGNDLTAVVVLFQQLFTPPAGQCLLHAAAEARLPVQGIDALPLLGGRLGVEQPQHRGVVGQHTGLLVNHQETLAHVLRDSDELLLPALQISHLPLDLPLLAAELGQQRRQLLIRLAAGWIVQVDVVDGLHQLPGHPGGQHHRQDEGQQHHQGHRLQCLQHQHPDRVLGAGYPQHRPVVKPLGSIQRLLGEGLGIAKRLALPQHQRLMDLLPLGVVLHLRRVLPVVVEHGPVRIHPGHPVAAGQIL